MQTIGERLEEARKRKGISIREAAEATKIRSDYLHKFESNQFDIRLPDIYLRGFLRNYANFLKLPGDRIVADFQALGFGEARSPKALNREVYGRMDISTSTGGAKDDSTPATSNTTPGLPVSAANAVVEQPTRKPATANPSSAETRFSSIGSSIKGININRSLLIKTGTLVAGAILLLILVVWGGVALFKGGKKEPISQPTTTTAQGTGNIAQPIGDYVSLVVANRPTTLKVTRVSDGRILYQSNAPLPVGTTVPLARELVWISTDAAENIAIDYRGRRFSHGQTGRKDFQVNLNSPQINL